MFLELHATSMLCLPSGECLRPDATVCAALMSAVYALMRVSVCLMESRNPPEDHDELIELVASDETGFLSLFSQQQLQEFMLFEREYRLSQLELQEELSSS
ncbi:hypothetical protein Bca52824_096420 [Brassica carinata]|uniref:Uncharacterized protein n=1 Tax=Brassica carinata TaxID=52824 RepID=A0A8X7NY06_BRACI|nr:hypothetical protein Bca52824_096420 [Brassica carinata]